MPTKNAMLVVIGSGPGIGSQTALFFAQRGFPKITLISRDAKRLSTEAEMIKTAASAQNQTVEVLTHAADITDLKALATALAEVEAFGTLECLFFNAAIIAPSPLLSHPTEDLNRDWQISVLALYEVSKWAMPHLLSLSKSDPESHPCLLVTNSLLYAYPIPDLFSLSVTKTAQRCLVQCLAKEYAKQGVHCAVVSVGGAVDEGNRSLNPGKIAERVWSVFEQERGAFEWDVEVLEGLW